MKKLMLAGVAVAAAFGAAQAQDTELVSNPRGMVTYFDTQSIGQVLTEMGAVWQQRVAPSGQPYLAVSAGGELTLNIIPTACQGDSFTKCVGMNTVALYSGAGFNYQTVTAFNQRYWFSTAGVAPDGTTAYVSRYEIADYGIPRGNIAASIYNLSELADRFRQELASSTQTVAMEGYADDLASRSLNSKGLFALAGSDAAQHMSRHERAMEETAELVKVLLTDADAPRNKVQNINAKN